MAQELTTWQPPQTKTTKKIVGGVLLVGGALAVAKGVTIVAPTITDAINLTQKLLASTTYMMVTGAVTIGVGLLIWDILSPHAPMGGKLNRLLGAAYSSFCNKLTWALVEVDPITPLTDKRAEMEARKREYDEAFASFDGMLRHIVETKNRYVTQAADAENRAKAASRTMATNPEMKRAFDSESYKHGSFVKASTDFARMEAQLRPVRDTIVRLQEAAAQVISQLDIDISVLKERWQLQQDMAKMDKSARRILTKSDQAALAQQAQELIERNYAVQIGRLENLSTATQPLLDSINLDKATFSEDLLVKWQEEAAEAIEVKVVSSQPVQPVALAAPVQADVMKLIR